MWKVSIDEEEKKVILDNSVGHSLYLDYENIDGNVVINEDKLSSLNTFDKADVLSAIKSYNARVHNKRN